MGLPPEKWAALKELQRSSRQKPSDEGAATIFGRLVGRDEQQRITNPRRSRRPARRAREKGK
jgi:hypothetical protein